MSVAQNNNGTITGEDKIATANWNHLSLLILLIKVGNFKIF